ncbi:MAG: SMP-30/gluconolactonase/LRE family protein [Marinovum sp.]|nr:SMP-30/gluconolactonase/LRE family protein [Marinovum sp.]
MAFDDRICALGEGPLWHPERKQFFWFDIMEKRLLTPGAEWGLGEYVSAAGWVDHTHLLIASQSALFTFSIESGAREDVVTLEAENAVTRSNDGRADPQGGFWIGTMGIGLQTDAGAIYRYYRGELRQLFAPITIPNATCFAPNGKRAYFADTPTHKIFTVSLDAHGWPIGSPEVFVDLSSDRLHPDGAVVDAAGNLWVALWGPGQVVGFDPQGQKIEKGFRLPAHQTTCPAFGGPGLSQMLVTSAAEGLDPAALVAAPENGMTFLMDTHFVGQTEHQVVL